MFIFRFLFAAIMLPSWLLVEAFGQLLLMIAVWLQAPIDEQ